MSEQLTLDVDPPAPPPVMVVGVCHWCGARTEPIPAAAYDGDTRWFAGAMFAVLALEDHRRAGCPGAPPPAG